MNYKVKSKIVNYPLPTDPETGSGIFSIHKNNFVQNYVSSDFLIPHRKDYYFFALILDVRDFSRHWIDMKPYDLKAKKLYFTEPSQVQLKEESCAIHTYNMNFTKEFLSLENQNSIKDLPIIQNPDKGHMLHLTDENFAFLVDILNKIYAEYQAQREWQHTMLLSYVRVFLIYCSRLYTEQFENEKDPESLLLVNFLTLVDEKYKEEHEVSHYAQQLNISAGYLGDTIKQQSGKSAIAHIQERIVLEAKRLIYFTEESMKEIAFSLGFEDASYFNRFFKRHTDFTPLAYKKHLRKMYH